MRCWYDVGIAAGAMVGGLVLAGTSAWRLPWLSALLVAGGLATVLTARKLAFPSGQSWQRQAIAPPIPRGFAVMLRIW